MTELVSTLSRILAVAIAAFVAIASGVLLWDGIALGAAHGHALPGHPTRAARLRLAIGAVGLAVSLWLALGLFTHAH